MNEAITAEELYFTNYGHNCTEFPTEANGHVKCAFDRGVRKLEKQKQKKKANSQNGHLLNCISHITSHKRAPSTSETSDTKTDSAVMANQSDIEN